MKNLKLLILVIAFICYSCAKNKDETKSLSIEEAPIEVFEENITIDEADLEYRKDIAVDANINQTLILQKLNELVELNQLKQQQISFKAEIDEQILTLTRNIDLLVSLPEKATIDKLKYHSSLRRINDSTETIDFSFQLGATKHLLTANIISSKKEIDNTTYNSQKVTFETKE